MTTLDDLRAFARFELHIETVVGAALPSANGGIAVRIEARDSRGQLLGFAHDHVARDSKTSLQDAVAALIESTGAWKLRAYP